MGSLVDHSKVTKVRILNCGKWSGLPLLCLSVNKNALFWQKSAKDPFLVVTKADSEWLLRKQLNSLLF